MNNKKFALLSVFNKEGIVEFAQNLVHMGWSILSSGGTHKTLVSSGVLSLDVAEITGQKPILEQRVATLHPHIHGGLLATETMLEELERLGYPWIDLVCVDFYPLEVAILQAQATPESILKTTDIGGPTLLRSGAKGRRITICDPNDRELILRWLDAGSPDNDTIRTALAAKTELVVAHYCMISGQYTQKLAASMPIMDGQAHMFRTLLTATSPKLTHLNPDA